jgi:predicted ferric reductase
MKRFQSIFVSVIIFVIIVTPILLWIPYANFSSKRGVFLSLGQVSALIGYSLYLFNFIISSRFNILDRIFTGINRMYISHHLYGVSAFILLLLHPLFISLSYLTISLCAAFIFVLPSLGNLPQFFGTLALLVTIILLIITLYVNIEYDRWKLTHKFLGLGLFFSAIHLLFIGSTLAVSFPLQVYFYFLASVAFISYLRKTVFGRYFVRRKQFRIRNVEIESDVMKISMETVDSSSLIFQPGQFVFVEFKQKIIPLQSHPFSITSSPKESELSLGIKILGDYTQTLKALQAGDIALVEGPYGRFSFTFYPNRNQIWIAGGVGITPFVSMAKSLPGYIRTVLYYCVSEKTEAVFQKDLEQIEKEKENFNLVLWDSKSKGRFSINEVKNSFNPIADYFICGPPPMMKSLKEQLIKKGIAKKNIHTEEFTFT